MSVWLPVIVTEPVPLLLTCALPLAVAASVPCSTESVVVRAEGGERGVDVGLAAGDRDRAGAAVADVRAAAGGGRQRAVQHRERGGYSAGGVGFADRDRVG